ncbi:MAG: RagB/SusD family nutrient uptake outer membrane protein [Tunicatimonas sp.]
MKRIRTQLARSFTVVAVLLSLSNCNEERFFELDRPPQNPWTTLNDFDRAVTGAYGVLFGSRAWVQAWPNYAVPLTSLGDDVAYVNDPQWGYLRNTEQVVDLVERNSWLAYRGLAGVNEALDFVEENDGNPYLEASTSDVENQLNRMVGELHFLRGFIYFMLETTFGQAYVPGGDNATPDITLHTDFVESAEEARDPKIGTTQEVWDLIRADLEMAKELLPEKYDPAVHPAGYQVRANRFAAAALLMRTYFQRGEYDLAAQECDYIIANGGYQLDEEPIDAFNKSGLAEVGNEVIFYLPYSDISLFPPWHLSVLNATWNGQKCVWNETRMSFSAIEQLGWMEAPGKEEDVSFTLAARRDKRFQQLMKVRYPTQWSESLRRTFAGDSLSVSRSDDVKTIDQLIRESLGYDLASDDRISNITTIWPWKYFRGPGEDYTNLPLIRLPEVYLTRAIIRFNAGDPAGAAADLNVVRKRAWDTAVDPAYWDLTAAEVTAEVIHRERLAELFNEADRLNYLRGLKVPIPQGDRGDGSDPYTSEKFIWAIPSGEWQYNNSL